MRAIRLLFSTLFLLPLALFGSEYLFSYKLVSKNGLVINEEFNLVLAMTKSGTGYGRKLCEILVEESDFNTTKEALLGYREEILECLLKNGIKLRSDSEMKGFVDTSTSTLSIKPTRLEFFYDGLKLSILEVEG